MKCPAVQLSLGAYVLGALGRREARRITAHVADCEVCRSELVELARLRPMLERLSLEQLDAEFGLVGEPRTAPVVKPPPRGRLVLVACLLLAALVAGGTATVVAMWPSSTVTAQAQPSSVTVTDPATKVVVDAMLTARPTGTSITVSLTGGRPGEWCWLVAVAQDGRMQQFASWQVTSGGDVTVSAYTEIKRPDLTQIRVVRDDQSLLANLNVG